MGSPLSSSRPIDSSSDPVAVVGAGPSGLPVCKALSEAGIDYECFEAEAEVGGVWNFESHQTGAYRSLNTNTSTKAMAYSDFPFEVETPKHLSAAELQEYFADYADHFELNGNIRLGTRVESARPLGAAEEGAEESWELTLSTGEKRTYSALIVATGQYARPRWPSEPPPAAFAGDALHVFDYFDPVTPVDLRGRKVLVVGLGSSAAEVAAELSKPDHPIGSASEVHLSARSGRWVVSKIVNGRPLDAAVPHPAAPLPSLLRRLPASLSTALLRRLMKWGLGRMVATSGTPESLGLPVPSLEPWEDRPTMSTDFIEALRAGRIHVQTGMRGIEGHEVEFTNGVKEKYDAILYATGYALDFPFLSEETLGCAAPDLSLYQKIAHSEHERLFFVGCLRVNCSMWPVAEQQARWVAKALAGAFSLPPAQKRKGAAESLAKELPVMCPVYIEGLRREAGGL